MCMYCIVFVDAMCCTFNFRPPTCGPTSPYRKQSCEESLQPTLRRVSSGGKNPPIPQPPSTPHDRHHAVKTRSAISSQADINDLRRDRFSPSPPNSASLVPSPPNSAKTNRPSSAARFRKRVLECRNSFD